MKCENRDNLEKDIEKYRNMCDIADRMIELSMGQRTLNSDDSNVIEFLSDSKKIEVLKSKFNNSDRSNKHLAYIASLDRETETLNLMNRMKNATNRRRILRFKRVASVAAVLLLSFFVYHIADKIDKTDGTVSYNSEQYNDVPKIILANGKQIDLEHAASDKVAISENISIVDKRNVRYVSDDELNDSEIQYNKIVVPSKYTYNIELADGTIVTLNANSSLKYPVRFADDTRNVELNGEAYFKVAKSDKPFIVKAEDCSIKVYGTEFNVNTHKRNVIETILVEGSIGFTANNNVEIMMKPNQMIRLDKENNGLDLRDVDVEKYFGWRNGFFFYEQEKFIVFLDEIAQWYGVKFNINNKSIEDVEISINVDRNIPLSNLLDIMGDMFDVKIINEGKGNFSIL